MSVKQVELLSPRRRHLQWINADDAEEFVKSGYTYWSRQKDASGVARRVVVAKSIPAVFLPASTISSFEVMVNADLANCSPAVRQAIKFKVLNYHKIH